LKSPTLNGISVDPNQEKGTAVYGEITGYVQQIYMSNLQGITVERLDAIITINAVPGTFSKP
jgi:hypothetical protein